MKPKLIIYDTNRDITTKVVLKFAQGASTDNSHEVRFVKIDRFNKVGFDRTLRPGIDSVASLGVLRGTGELFKTAYAVGVNYYYLDHAYFNPGYGGDGWMRIVKNGHSRTDFKVSSPDRFNKFFAKSNPILPWKDNSSRGDKIVVCPPTHAVAWYMDLTTDWTDSVVTKLKSILPENQHHRIVVRPKPNEPLVDKKGNLLGFQQNVSKGSLDDDLNNACCVISYNSMVALTATLRGIPVIVSEHSCCKPISYSLDDFKQNPYPDQFNSEPAIRHGLIYWLANNQWNANEIQTGIAWTQLQDNYR